MPKTNAVLAPVCPDRWSRPMADDVAACEEILAQLVQRHDDAIARRGIIGARRLEIAYEAHTPARPASGARCRGSPASSPIRAAPVGAEAEALSLFVTARQTIRALACGRGG
jgi:hypothetical protein